MALGRVVQPPVEVQILDGVVLDFQEFDVLGRQVVRDDIGPSRLWETSHFPFPMTQNVSSFGVVLAWKLSGANP